MSDEQASNYSVQPRYPFPQSPPMGALAAADSYAPTDWPAGPAKLPDIGAPLVSPGPQVSAGAPWANRLVDTMTTPRQAEDDNTVLYKTASPRVNFTQADINRGLDLGLSFSGGGLGIKAYHGSPHDFDRFDMSRIGTGEGAQAYGHGLYFAENPEVARSYRSINAPPGQGPGAAKLANDALNMAHDTGLTGEEAKRFATEYLTNQAPKVNALSPQHYYDAVNNFDALTTGKGAHGRMYEVNINADPAHFLDWDKPLSEQHPIVQEALKAQGINTTRSLENMKETRAGLVGLTGEDAVRRIARPSYPIRDDKASPWKASDAKTYDEALAMVGGDKSRVNRMLTPDPAYTGQALNQAGIPGIKYLDEGSRNARPVMKTTPHGDVVASHYPAPTSNYVLFNDKLIDILRKYGLAGAAPAGMGALAAQDNYPPQ